MKVDEIKKEEKINLTMELVNNGAIIEFPDDYIKFVVEGYKEPFYSIADDIKGTIDSMMESKYKIEIKITAL